MGRAKEQINNLIACVEYILGSERYDFEEQCAEHGLTFEEGLEKLNTHVYFHASKAFDFLVMGLVVTR